MESPAIERYRTKPKYAGRIMKLGLVDANLWEKYPKELVTYPNVIIVSLN